jgi:hypothetical protein
MHNRKFWYGLSALVAAWVFDFLFWQKTGGISFVIWTTILLGLGYLLAWREGKKPSRWSYVLTALILGFALISAWRSETVTRLTSILMVLAGLVLLVTTFLNGHWLAYRLVDYIVEFWKTAWAGLSRGFGLFVRNEEIGNPPNLPGQRKGVKRLGSVALGLIIALPILVILGLMLAAADPIFSDMVKRLFSIENLPQYLFRFAYIVVGAYVLVGLFLHAVSPLKPAEKPDTQKTAIAPFLGAIEGNIVLGAVNLLFIAFVIIQVRYLFGGSANINETGYTYADYARRGFGELVGVAILSLLLYLAFNAITKRESKPAQVGFSALSVLLIANVLVILASSLMRLLMYEDAYGFSEVRTYTHVFIFWLAGLLVAAIVLELIRKRGYFGLALMITIVGYCASLGLMNVDGFVAKNDIQHAAQGHDLDVEYLAELTTDAVPALITAYQDPTLPETVHDGLGVQLACRTQGLQYVQETDWRGFRFGQSRAVQLLKQNESSWSKYTALVKAEDGSTVIMGTHSYWCNPIQVND